MSIMAATGYVKNGQRDTYDNNEQTEIQGPLVQRPDAVGKKYLNNQRDDCIYRRTVYRGEIGVFEAIHVSEADHEPKVDIGPRQRRLNSLQEKYGVG
jgi:hypothetical protein